MMRGAGGSGDDEGGKGGGDRDGGDESDGADKTRTALLRCGGRRVRRPLIAPAVQMAAASSVNAAATRRLRAASTPSS